MLRYLMLAAALFAAPAAAQTITEVPNGKTVILAADEWVSITHQIAMPDETGIMPAPRKYGTTGKWFYNDNRNSIAISNTQTIKYQGPCGVRYCYSLPTYTPPAPKAPATASSNIKFKGPLFAINVAGMTFVDNGALAPTEASINQYLDKGFTGVRYPFKVAQLRDPKNGAANMKRLIGAANATIARGAYFVLDRHEYTWESPEKMTEFWVWLLKQMPKSDLIIIDPMNEPKNFNDPVLTNDWDQWARDTNLFIAQAREAGITNIIAPEYPQWSATFRFDKKEGPTKACESAGCALDRAGGLKDPLGLTLINGHRYWDKGSSGTNAVCDTTSSGLDDFAAQLRKRGLKGVVTEAAFGSAKGVHSTCVAVGNDAVTDLRANSNDVVAVFWWGGGAGWTESYWGKVEPTKGTFGTAPNSPYLNTLLGK